jgi:hypothetical protein
MQGRLSFNPHRAAPSRAATNPTYGHVAWDSEDSTRARLEARSDRSGVEMAFGSDGGDAR